MAQALTTKTLFERDDVKSKFQEILGKKSTSFITSVLQIVTASADLKNADPTSVYQVAAMAATLDLPLNNNLGFAYIIPYNQSYKDEKGNWQKKTVATFQMGYKGFIQLAQRSGQCQTISAAPIYEGQLIEENPLTGFIFNFSKKTSEKIIGFAAYIRLINGFEKTFYMNVDQLKSHAGKYSQTYKSEKTRKDSKWETDFEAMSTKTVLKLLLSKYSPLSVDMQTALAADQSVIKNIDTMELEYVDNQSQTLDEVFAKQEHNRVTAFIEKLTTIEDAEILRDSCETEELIALLDEKIKNLNK